MDTNWFVDLFLFCYEMDFMVSLSNNKQANTILRLLTLKPDIWLTFET